MSFSAFFIIVKSSLQFEAELLTVLSSYFMTIATCILSTTEHSLSLSEVALRLGNRF